MTQEETSTSAPRVRQMTDAGSFERMMSAVLRAADPRYRSLIRTGTNARNQTVKAPMDAMCLVQGSIPPHFVFAAHTLTSESKLEDKWLFDHTTGRRKNAGPASDGDIIKAEREYSKIRAANSQATCTLVLTCNESPSQDLIKRIHQDVLSRGMELDLWTQTRISDFLDDTAEGQWIRQEHLGVKSQRLSRSLLNNLCEQNLSLYRQEFISDPLNAVVRSAVSDIERSLADDRTGVTLVVAESGYGKSTLCWGALSAWRQRGMMGMRIMPSIICATI